LEAVVKVRRLGTVTALLMVGCMLLAVGCGDKTVIVVDPGGLATDTKEAQDAAAKSLLRNSMTAIESAYVDLRTFVPGPEMAAALVDIEPSITFVAVGSSGAAAATPTAAAARDEVNYCGTETTYAVGTMSESGWTFGVEVNKGPGGGNFFYVNGAQEAW
jgi:hypothetical protein